LRDFRGDLGLKAEAILLDVDAFNDLSAERFVTRFHVGEIEVGEHVRGSGEYPVPDGMPEVQNTVGTPCKES
jgi:hypothetical protein